MAEIATSSAASACEDCSGRGWIITPDGGAGAARPCSCRTAVPVGERMRRAGVGEDLLHASLEAWDEPANGPLDDRVLAYAEVPRGFLTLLGEPGRGKSHAAAGVLRSHLSRGGYGRWCDLQLLIQQVTGDGNWERGREIEAALQSTPLAVLDDLGAERDTDYSRDVVTRIIRARHAAQLPTVVTSNLPLATPPGRRMRDGEPPSIQDWEPRIASRLASGPVIELQGKDYRLLRQLRRQPAEVAR